LVQFRFHKPEIEKTELNPNRKKPKKNRAKLKNQAKPILTGFYPKKPNRTETEPNKQWSLLPSVIIKRQRIRDSA
jgi:hypothetical protein